MGTLISDTLALVGVTEQSVSAWLGRPCNCDDYRRRLDALGSWAATVARKGPAKAKAWLSALMDVQ
jgi:hypothetical protein